LSWTNGLVVLASVLVDVGLLRAGAGRRQSRTAKA
jgi:hypothetical protein